MTYTWERAEKEYQAEIDALEEVMAECAEVGDHRAVAKADRELKRWTRDLEDIKNEIGEPEDYIF